MCIYIRPPSIPLFRLFLFVACFDVIIEGSLRFSLCFHLSIFFYNTSFIDVIIEVTLELTLSRIHSRLMHTLANFSTSCVEG